LPRVPRAVAVAPRPAPPVPPPTRPSPPAHALRPAGLPPPAAGPLDGPFDVVPRDGIAPGFLHGRRQRHVAFDARAALPRGHLDGPPELAAHPPALLVGGGLLPLDLGPLGAPGHRSLYPRSPPPS